MPSAAPICSQQRAPRRWLIGTTGNRDNFRSSSTRPVSAKAWATAPQFCGLKSLTRRDPRLRRSLLLGLDIRRTRRRGSRGPSNVAQIVCSGICREYRSYRVSDRKIAARCPDVPRDQVKCRQTRDYHDFIISSVFSATDHPLREALLTVNWRG